MSENLSERQRMTVSTLGSMTGCCELFPLCTNEDIVAMSFQGTEPFLDWLGWELTQVCNVEYGYIDWIRPAQSEGSPTPGYLADPCSDGNGVEFGVCTFRLSDFGRLRRVGPVRDVTMTGVSLCERYPRWRLGGQRITDEREWSLRLAMEAILQDLKRMVVSGNAATAGQFSGLNTLIKTGYTDPTGRRCASMDSNVIEWGGNDLSGAGGGAMSWNGTTIPSGTALVSALLEAYRTVRQRLMWSSLPGGGNLRVGEMVLALPTFLARGLLDAYTCWSVCPGQQYNEANLNTFEARMFRNNLLGGMFGAGRIFLDGFEVPLITYDWETISGTNQGSMYLLVNQVGGVPLLRGQLNDMAPVVAGDRFGKYATTDGGRVLLWEDTDNTCTRLSVEMRPRLLMWAPWAQTRIQNVEHVTLRGPLSPDPNETSFFYETSFTPAACQ